MGADEANRRAEADLVAAGGEREPEPPSAAYAGAIDRLAEALLRADATKEVAAIAAEQLRLTFDAALVMVTLADERAGGLLSLGASGMRNRDPGVEPLLPFATPTLMTDAFRAPGSLVISREEYVERYPHMAGSIPDSRIVMAVGRRFVGPDAAGAVSMCFADHRRFAAPDEALLDRLLAMLPDAFARARASERERSASRTLQRALLSEDHLVDLEGWQRATRYRPASDDARVGGDWFDVFEVAPGRIGVAVGDVVGKGAAAAGVMGQLRAALRALARVADGPGHALDELDRFGGDVEGAFAATALLAVVDTARRQVRLATAGHPPPVVATGTGTRVLRAARGVPLGVGLGATREEQVIELAEEDTIVFFTDGLVERRGETIDDGIARLATVLAEDRARPLERLVDDAIDTCATGDDDLALVALRPVGARPRTFSTSTTSDPHALRTTRRALRAWLDALDVDQDRTGDVVLAASEAMTNARDHAYQGADDGSIVLDAWLADGSVHVTVRDHGRWAPSVRSPVRGRGLSIIAAVTEHHELHPTPHGTEVRFAAPVTPGPS